MQHFVAIALGAFLLAAVPVRLESPHATLKGQQDISNAIQETDRQATSGVPSSSNPLGIPSPVANNPFGTLPSLTLPTTATSTFGSPDPMTQLLMDNQKKSMELLQQYTQQMTQLQTQLAQDQQKLAQELNDGINALLKQGK